MGTRGTPVYRKENIHCVSIVVFRTDVVYQCFALSKKNIVTFLYSLTWKGPRNKKEKVFQRSIEILVDLST